MHPSMAFPSPSTIKQLVIMIYKSYILRRIFHIDHRSWQSVGKEGIVRLNSYGLSGL